MRILATISIFCACASTIAQQVIPKVRPHTPVEVQSLIESLGSRDYRERESAGKALSVEGDRILPSLKVGLAKSGSPEVQRRLTALIDKLDGERLLRPTLVSVDCTDAPVKVILADICKQAGYTLRDAGDANPAVTLKLTAVPFWEAMNAVAGVSGFTILPQNDAVKTIYAYPNDAVSPHTCVAGPFRFTASSIGGSRSVQLANIPRRDRLAHPEFLGLGVQISSEPKLPIVGIGEVALVKATDDKGHSLIPPVAEESRRAVRLYAAANHRSQNQTCSIDLVRGHRDATAIRRLDAKVAVEILVEERPEIAVENLLAAKTKTFAGTTLDLAVDEVDEAMGAVTIKLTFRQRPGETDTARAFDTAVQRLVVLDDRGHRLHTGGVTEQITGTESMTVRIGFSPRPGEKAGKPTKLMFNEWITKTREIAFHFENVPLP